MLYLVIVQCVIYIPRLEKPNLINKIYITLKLAGEIYVKVHYKYIYILHRKLIDEILLVYTRITGL
jgi:hypothetical protein